MADNIVVEVRDICFQNLDTSDTSAKSHLSLLDVNDNCLLKVFHFLDIIDMINLGDTCTRLREVAKMAAIKYTSFKLWDYMNYRKKVQQPLSLAKVFSYIAPYIVDLNIDGFFLQHDIDLILGRTLIDNHFIKMKCLGIDKSCLLKWINTSNLEVLVIREVKRDDLNNFTSGLTMLKKLRIGSIDGDVSTDELRYFLEKNPNIECFEFYWSFPLQFPYDILSQLRNLRRLDLTIKNMHPDWRSFMLIEKLSQLTIEVGNVDDYKPITNYLMNLARRGTLKEIELRNMRFGKYAYKSLELMNVTKIRIVNPKSSPRFFLKLADTSLTNLTHLDIIHKIGENMVFILIAMFKKLERLKVSFIKKFNRRSFLERIPNLFGLSNINRPNLILSNYCDAERVDNVLVKT